ncbi:MAG: DUF1015 domain-containing protein [Phycisphaerales bacterium]|nr:DUF1015 domain-containing protein [Phycisphaerales bacterium]
MTIPLVDQSPGVLDEEWTENTTILGRSRPAAAPRRSAGNLATLALPHRVDEDPLMLRVKPFAALRPHPSLASKVASPPYDVVDTDEARAIADGNPLSFLHVVRPEIDLPDGTDIHADEVYAKAAENFRRLIDDDILVREPEPRIYLYRQVRRHQAQIGIVACCHIDDYVNNIIRKHEKTRRDKEDDRTRHVLAINANAGPVFLTYRDRPDLTQLVETDVNARPLFHFVAPDGVTHTAWIAPDAAPYVEAFRTIDAAYVADGHHRSASAARAGAARRAQDPNPTPDAEYNWFLATLFPASQLTILPYNRLVADLNGLTPAGALAALGTVGRLSPTSDPVPGRAGVFCLYVDGGWHRLELDESTIDAADPIGSLDVSLLHDRVLGPLFGIGDPRTDDRINFVGGIRGTDELKRRVDAGKAALAVSMHPTSIEQLLSVSDAGAIMPPKSTWFEPKLRSGLFVHTLD